MRSPMRQPSAPSTQQKPANLRQGFVVFGQVVTKRTLWLATTAAYGVMVAFGPTFLGEVGLGASCGVGGQHAACPYGWTFADDKCFKLFGDDGIAEPPLFWAAAEEACHLMGMDTHLASVTSGEQQRAVAHLASSTGGKVWIGLNDADETGSWVWSDDEPLEYDNWTPGEPSGNSKQVSLESRTGNNLPGGWDDWNDAAQQLAGSNNLLGVTTCWDDWNDGTLPYICGKKATPSESSHSNCVDGDVR